MHSKRSRVDHAADRLLSVVLLSVIRRLISFRSSRILEEITSAFADYINSGYQNEDLG